MSKMGSHDPFEFLKHKLWPNEGSGVKLLIWIWLLTTKSRESPWFPCVKVTCHLTRATTLFQTSLQSEVFTQSYKPPKLRESQFQEFWDSHLGVSGQNDIWVLAPWLGTENTIRGKVVVSSKSGLWWVLWVDVCMWLICASKVLQLCTNQLVVWFVQVHVNNWIACRFS
jgi:hypothetical protein